MTTFCGKPGPGPSWSVIVRQAADADPPWGIEDLETIAEHDARIGLQYCSWYIDGFGNQVTTRVNFKGRVPGDPYPEDEVLQPVPALALVAGVSLVGTVDRERAGLPPNVPSWAALLFRIVEHVVPKRVAGEQIGDALEVIASDIHHGRAKAWIALKVASTLFWVMVNATREIVGAALGRDRK